MWAPALDIDTGGQTITSNPEGKPDHVRPGRGTHPAGTGMQPTTVHAICARGCALALRCVYDLASTTVETRDAMIAMTSDLRIGSASETRKLSCSERKSELVLTSLLARFHAIAPTGASI